MDQPRIAADKVGLSIAEAAVVMGVGRSSIYVMMRDGRLPARKIGRRTVILREDVAGALRSAPAVPTKGA